MLKDENIEYIKEQFCDKNKSLAKYGAKVSPWDFYADIFGDLERIMPVVVIGADADEDEKNILPMPINDAIEQSAKHILPMPICDAIEQSQIRNDVLMGGCTYFNNWISKKSARDVHAFIVDMDNVYSGTLENALKDDWKTANGEELPMPTYIVNSGTGLHLYFVFNEPIPNFKTEDIDRVYRALAVQQTTKRVYLQKQVQWFGQDFRLAGGLNKYGWSNSIFKVGEKWDADALAKAVGCDVHFVKRGEQRQTAPKPKTDKRKKRKPGWKTDRAWYDMALRTCREKTKEGNRYMSMCALSVIAYKCDIDLDELRKDLKNLLPIYNKNATRKVKPSEITSALKMYNEKAMLTQRESIETWQGWEYRPIPRKGRQQAEHLRRARKTQEADYPEGEWRNPSKSDIVKQWRSENPTGKKLDCHKQTGLPRVTVNKWWSDEKPAGNNGKQSKKDIVKAWRSAHPDGKKMDCHKETGLSRVTIDKWWNKEENDGENQ